MRRSRLTVKPNISLKGGRGTAALVKLEVKASEPVTETSQGKEQLAVSETPQCVIKKDAVQTIASKTEKCSPQKHETPLLTGTVTSVTKGVQRRSRIKPPVLVTRNRTSTAEVKRSPGDKRAPQNDAAIMSPSVAGNEHRVAALQLESKDVDETDATLPPQPSIDSETRLNAGGVEANIVVGDKLQDLVKVSPGSKEEPKHLSSPNAGNAIGSLRRSHFPKARPNLIDTGRHGRTRHPSQSETDEEAGKMLGPPSVQRVASLSPAISRLVPVSPDTRSSEIFVPPTCVSASPSKLSCGASVVEDVVETEPPEETLNKTLMSKTEKKQVIRKKRRKMEMLAGEVDRSKLTMRDLIYMNPVDNPMKSSVEEAEKRIKNKTEEQVRKQEEDTQREGKRDATEAAKSDEDNDDVITLEDEVQSVAGSERVDGGGREETKGEEEEEDSLVPQVTIGPDGNIVINQASLTIETNKTKGKEQDDWDIVTEEFSSTSLAYGRKPPSRLWKLNETKKFYVALSTVGTDFSLMSNLFPKRSRVELKRKFKREEKQNKHLVDTALKERRGFDVTLFEELSSDEEEEDVKRKKKASKRKGKNEKENQEVQKRKKGEDGGQRRKKKKKKRRSKYYDDSSSGSEVEETVNDDVNHPDLKRPALEVDNDDGCTTLPRVESPHPSDEEEAGILKTMCRTTRYGRKPRPIQTYEAPALATRKRRPSAPPGDTVPVASTSHFSSPPHAAVPARSVIMSPGRDMFARSPSGQLISLTNLGQSSPAAEMAGSQFVFVTSPPKPNADGTLSTSPQVIHVYLVSNTSAAPSGGLQQVLPSIEPPSETTSVPDITTAHISDVAQVLPCESNCERSPSSQDRHVTEVVRT